MDNSKINLAEYVGKDFFVVNGKTVNLPRTIDQIIIHKQRILICLNTTIPDLIRASLNNEHKQRLNEEELSWVNNYLSIVNSGVWGFDLQGKLLWKISEAYSAEVHKKEFEQTGHGVLAGYFGMRLLPIIEHVVVWTSHGDHLEVRIADGILIGHSKELQVRFGGEKVLVNTVSLKDKFLRFYNESMQRDMCGRFVIRSAEVEGLTMLQVQELFSMPILPTQVAVVKLPEGNLIYEGLAESGYGKKGGAGIRTFTMKWIKIGSMRYHCLTSNNLIS